MAEPDGKHRKIIKIKRINPIAETQDRNNIANTTLSTLGHGTSEVRKAYVSETSVQVFCI